METDYLCNLIVPGAAKSGTSSLHEYLNVHPNIEMSKDKEPHHFSRDTRFLQGPAAHNALFVMRPRFKYYGESSTTYLPSPKSLQRIAHNLVDPRAIIVLRHPVDRCFSHYRWRYRLGLENRSFLAAVTEDGYGYDPEQTTEFGYMSYLEFSNYAAHCTAWEKLLGAKNCMMITAEDLRANRAETLNACFEFLGLEPIALTEQADKLNETETLGRRPTKAMNRIAGLLPEAVRTSEIFRKAKKSMLRSVAPQPPKSMSEEENAYVTRMLAQDIAWYEAKFGSPDVSAPPSKPLNHD